jgi:hypothetical protein
VLHGASHCANPRRGLVGLKIGQLEIAEAIRRESEPDDAPRVPDRDADPLFRQAGVSLDEEG